VITKKLIKNFVKTLNQENSARNYYFTAILSFLKQQEEDFKATISK